METGHAPDDPPGGSFWSQSHTLSKFKCSLLGDGTYKIVAQSVTCLATDACLTADPGVASPGSVPYFRGD